MTRREENELMEKLCAARIDALMAAKGWTYQRTTADKEQWAGIDAWLTLDGRRRAVDEKAKYKDIEDGNWLGQDPKCGMAFEVNRVCRDGVRRTGWFCDPKSKTELYLFSFPAPRYGKALGLSYGLKERMKMWLFEKSDVEELAAQHGLEKDTLDCRAKDMLERGLTTFYAGPLKLQASAKYDEAPVNLVIPCGLLRGLKSFQEFWA